MTMPVDPSPEGIAPLTFAIIEGHSWVSVDDLTFALTTIQADLADHPLRSQMIGALRDLIEHSAATAEQIS